MGFYGPDTSMISFVPTALEPRFWSFEFQSLDIKGLGMTPMHR